MGNEVCLLSWLQVQLQVLSPGVHLNASVNTDSPPGYSNGLIWTYPDWCWWMMKDSVCPWHSGWSSTNYHEIWCKQLHIVEEDVMQDTPWMDWKVIATVVHMYIRDCSGVLRIRMYNVLENRYSSSAQYWTIPHLSTTLYVEVVLPTVLDRWFRSGF